MALKRMAQRWEAARGTLEPLWRADARNYIGQLAGLRALEWIDASNHVRWVEPLKGNESAIGLHVMFDQTRAQALQGAAERRSITLTPPLDLVQGYKAFIAYAPLKMEDRFAGFLAGVVAIDDFLGSAVDPEASRDFAVSVSFAGREFFRNGATGAMRGGWTQQRDFSIYDKTWNVTVTPTEEFVSGRTTSLPAFVLASGLLIAGLLALTVRYILISRLSSARLQTSERTIREAMESAPIGMALVSTAGRWIKVNPALCSLLGYTEEELLATDFQSLTYAPDLETDLGLVRQVLERQIESYTMEKRYFHKGGHLVTAALFVSVVRDSTGAPAYFVAQIQDLTQQKAMERMKREFIAVVSHELRTPVTAIRGSLGLLTGALSKEMPENVAHLVGMAHRNSERLGLLINDILDLEKLESGQLQMHLARLQVAPLLRQALEVNQGYGQKHQVRFELEPVAEGLFVTADSDRLMQVMANLLSNAAKFSPAGSAVQVSAREAGEHVRFEVRDPGAGIPAEFQSRIFQKFAQADASSSRKSEGTGLGLSITRQLVEAMGGTIGFTSTEGVGTTFHFELPREAFPGTWIAQSRT